ncbi:hypothetical protein K2P47_01395 [Patescibacteria group bacterium]|nr:hypothetical protein [Patescibacteria group bacterium]
MRQTILAALLMALPANVTHAQTIGDEVYTAYQHQLVTDAQYLISFLEELNFALSGHGSLSEVSEFDQTLLRYKADDMLQLVDEMRERGQAMFNRIEHNYEQYCLGSISGPLPCSEYKATYREMIADTLLLGTIYYMVTEESQEILSALHE